MSPRRRSLGLLGLWLLGGGIACRRQSAPPPAPAATPAVREDAAAAPEMGTEDLPATLRGLCEHLRQEGLTVDRVAAHLGTPVVDLGRGAGVVVRPRDPRFLEGLVGRGWEGERPTRVELRVANPSLFRISTLKRAFGPYVLMPRQHPEEPDWLVFRWEEGPTARYACSITAESRLGYDASDARSAVDRVSIEAEDWGDDAPARPMPR